MSSTTEDHNALNVSVAEIASPKALDSALIRSANAGYVQDIKDFLAKPYPIRTGTWSGASAYQLAAISLPYEMLNLPMYQKKTDGYLAFRATIVLKLQVNCDRFQQGRLIMSYVPQGTVTGTNVYGRVNNLMKLTQLPNVQLDAACDTEAVLRIPYVSPTSHYNLLDQSGNCAAAFLHVYLPLLFGTGSSTASYTVWCHFDDVELLTPTLDSSFISQSGRIPSERELNNKRSGPVESVFTGLSGLATKLMGIPTLSSVAAPASWVLAAFAKTAGHFGWSNPRDEGPVTKHKRITYPYLGNSDAQDASQPLALKSQNKVEMLPGFAGSDMDEMNINFIASRPAYYQTVTWTSAATAGTQLFAAPLTPVQFRATSTFGTTPILELVDYVPCSFLCDIFQYWRGSLKFTIKFAKTDFHSGRLLVAYGPGVKSTATPTIPDTNYLHRSIVDVREGNEFTFVFPYSSTLTWLESIPQGSGHQGFYGRMWIKVLNPLVCPDTVSPNISFAVEVSMDEDAQFCVPMPFSGKAASIQQSDFASQCGSIFNLKKLLFGKLNVTNMPYSPDCFVSQAGDLKDTTPACAIAPIDTTVGASVRKTIDYAANKFCIGETIDSLLHLTKLSATITCFGTGWTNAATTSWLEIAPFTIGGRGVYSTATNDQSSMAGDWISILSPLYAYSRGGVRFHFTPPQNNTATTLTAYLAPNTGNIFAASNNPVAAVFGHNPYNENNGLVAVSNLTTDGNLSVEIPQYHVLHSRLNRITISDYTGAGPSEPMDLYSPNFELMVQSSATNIKHTIRRQAGDDFALGFFVGIPTYVVGSH